MIAYHGTYHPNFKPEAHVNSRYGFPVLFCTPDKELALLYALYNAKYVPSIGNKGYLYQFEIPEADKIYDFKRQITYSLPFRNLVYKIRDDDNRIALIKNCYDWPCEALQDLVINDIYMVFDFSLVRNIKLLEVI